MNLFNAHRTGHLSVAILFLSGLASMGHLAWPEIARLAVIVVGIVVAYTRYRDKLDDPVYRRPATALLALTCAFALTQFDPDTSIAGRYEQSPHMWTAQFAYLLYPFSLSLPGPIARHYIPPRGPAWTVS